MGRWQVGAVAALWLVMAPVVADEQLDAQLMEAVYEHKSTEVERLLAAGASIESTGYSGSTPLVWAAMEKDLPTLNLLLAKGANPNAMNALGQTPLIMAAANPQVAELLIAGGANLSLADRNGVTPLMHAASEGSEVVVKLLLEKGADAKGVDGRGNGLLYYALLAGKKKAAPIYQLLAAAGAPTNQVAEDGRTLLMQAVADGHKAIARELLMAGADPWVQDKAGKGVLDYAVGGLGTDLPLLKLLIGHRPPQAALDRALLSAVRADNVEGLLWLYAHGADVSVQHAGQPLLVAAVASNSWVAARELLRLGRSADEPSERGETALAAAVANERLELARLLLRYGADPDLAGEQGLAPLALAVDRGSLELAALLVAAGASTNVTIYDVPLKTVAKEQENKELQALLKKKKAKDRAQWGLLPLEGKGIDKQLVGHWQDGDGEVDLTLTKDGSYQRTITLFGPPTIDRGRWTAQSGDLVLSPEGRPVRYRFPLMGVQPDTFSVVGGVGPLSYRRAK